MTASEEYEVVDLGTCDYLVVGAGASSLAFVDTLLTELRSSTEDGGEGDANGGGQQQQTPTRRRRRHPTVVLVDRRADGPGGHWNDAYGYVRLHQPSLLYGVASRQLEGNWARLLLGRWQLPWNHRATQREILQYFGDVVADWQSSGKLRYFPNCDFDFGQLNTDSDDVGPRTYEFVERRRSGDGDDAGAPSTKQKLYRLCVQHKLVNGVLGEPQIPSNCPPEFEIDPGVKLITPNQLYDEFYGNNSIDNNSAGAGTSWFRDSTTSPRSDSTKNKNKKKYTVLGCGKTGMDAVVFLQRDMKVPPADIGWIISNDVWMLSRAKGGPSAYPQALLDNDGDAVAACLQLERDGTLVRLDSDVLPTRFRFPVVGADELELMRKVKNVVRGRGRVTSIRQAVDGGETTEVRVNFGTDREPWILSCKDDDDEVEHVFVHCTSPGPFNGKKPDATFESDHVLNLFLLYAPPVSISMSCLAMLEASRRNGALDLEYGRELLTKSGLLSENDGVTETSLLTENDVLRHLIKPMMLSHDNKYDRIADELVPFATVAAFFALLRPDVALKWMKTNRLSFFAVPKYKGRVYENARELSRRYRTFGYTASEGKLFKLLADRLESLEGY